MRKIKFRCWYEDGTGFDYQPTIWDGKVWNPVEDIEDKGVVIQQFTGLKDKNGKEIYEGDIVRFVVDYDFDTPPQPTYDSEHGTEMIDTVEFHDGAFFFMTKYGMGAYANIHNKHCEIIGNLYENPELL